MSTATDQPSFESTVAADLPDLGGVFDPNAAVVAPDAALFDDIVAVGDTSDVDAPNLAVVAEMREQLASTTFGTLSVEDFSAFDTADFTPEIGEYHFSIEQKYLKEAATTTDLTISKTSAQFGAVKITIFADQLRLQTFNQAAFTEAFIPLHGKANPAPEKGKEISFVFDHGILKKIAQTFDAASIDFKFVADKHTLVIQQDESVLPISTYARNIFTDYHVKIGQKTLLGKINPVIFRQGVAYLSHFARRDDIQANLSMIEFRNGEVVGGSTAALGIFRSPVFAGAALKVKYETIATLEKMLSRFNPENTHLLETDSYYILRDDNLFFGFEKSANNFPNLDAFFQVPSNEHALVPRSQLVSLLTRLSVVNTDRDLFVNLKLEGSGTDASLMLTTKDATGKEAHSKLICTRTFNEGKTSDFAPWDINVNVAAFIKVISHFESANVHLEILGKKAMLITDEGESFDARTLLAVQSEEQIARQKAAREAAKVKNTGPEAQAA